MLAQYIKQKGYDEGIQQGIQKGIQEGIQKGKKEMVLRSLDAGLEIEPPMSELIKKMTIDPHIIKSEIKKKLPYSPCRAACPVHIDVRNYVGLIAQGRYAEAFEVIRSVNPIASACSLICYHPCEEACRRSDVDEPIAIRHLKRFAMEQATEYRRKKRKSVPHTRKEKIAIIGSGPSGLTAANDLADLGYHVTIFEKYHELGGMLVSAIPPYRLPRNVLKEDIDDILAKGVETKTGCEIGKDLSFNDILSEYNAVLIAVGLSQPLSLPIPGVEGDGVLLALPFLENIAFGKKPQLGKQLLIIGGGNVAIDVRPIFAAHRT